jgi:hypothetical protein
MYLPSAKPKEAWAAKYSAYVVYLTAGEDKYRPYHHPEIPSGYNNIILVEFQDNKISEIIVRIHHG